MKFFALIFLFGLATASFHDILDDSDEEDFILKSGHKKDKDDLQTELGKQLRKTLDHILKDIKDAVQDGKGVSQKLLDEARDLVHKLKRYGFDVSNEAKDLVDYLKTRVDRWAEELLDILSDNSTEVHREQNALRAKRDIVEQFRNLIQRYKLEEKIKGLRELLDGEGDISAKFENFVQKHFSRSKFLLRKIKYFFEEGKDKLKAILDKVLRKKETRNVYDKILDLEELNIKEKFQKLKDMVSEGISNSIIREFIMKEIPDKLHWLKKIFLDALKGGGEKLEKLLDRIFHRDSGF